jgi:hypothetical protein
MSAFVVSDRHINTILSAANRAGRSNLIHVGGVRYLRLDQVDDLQAMAEILLAENVRSVNCRYRESAEPHAITFEFCADVVPIEVIKLCQCYAYQACETDDYRDTAAAKIIEHIQSMMLSRLPGYGSAQWAISA